MLDEKLRSILITGGSGYLGQGLVPRLLADGCERICVYSRDEAKHARMRNILGDDGGRVRYFLGDVRDLDRLRLAMKGCDYVIHAAALKRVDAIEYNVIEGFATNVFGAENVVRASIDAGVKRAVLVSTDKACEPTTVYGITKAGAEAIFRNARHYAGSHDTTFGIVRYGNVAGSTESVIPTWRAQLARGEPCEVRHPDATRFWMTLEEAVDFVLQALRSPASRLDPLVPDLPAYRLGDLAAAMGLKNWRLTALRDGEKLHESMVPGYPSNLARRMTLGELQAGLRNV